MNFGTKVNTLDYMLHQLEEADSDNQFLFFTPKIKDTKDILTQLSDELDTSKGEIIIRGTLTNDGSENLFVYGYVRAYIDETISQPFIALFDFNSSMVFFTQTTRGGGGLFTNYCLAQDSDGYIYGFAKDGNTTRILLYNNVFLKNASGNYEVVLRKSYVVPYTGFYTYDENFSKYQIIKKNDSPEYYLTGCEVVSSSIQTTVIKFVINVGSENEWKKYNYNSISANYAFAVDVTGNYHYYGLTPSGPAYIELILSDDALTLSKNISLANKNIYFGAYKEHVEKTDTNVVYFSVSKTDGGSNLYEVSENSVVLRNSANGYTDSTQTLYAEITLLSIGDTLILKAINPMAPNIYFQRLGWLYKNNFGSFVSDILLKNINTSLNFGNSYSSVICYTNQYNLFNFYTFAYPENSSVTERVQIIYNKFNYNGAIKINTDAVISNSSILYDADNYPIFARNLYNRVQNDNVVTSIVQIPNTLLADVNIDKKELISKSNYVMVNDQNQLITNIYETLYINFINTYNIINNNDPDNSVVNRDGASGLTSSITDSEYYNPKSLQKYKINYQDGTATTFDLAPSNLTKITRGYYRVNLALNLSKKANTLKFISNDGTISFCTIEIFNLEINTTYTFKQDIHISDVTLQRQNIEYNNEQLQYNGINVIYEY